jgi:hypothetical protein
MGNWKEKKEKRGKKQKQNGKKKNTLEKSPTECLPQCQQKRFDHALSLGIA